MRTSAAKFALVLIPLLFVSAWARSPGAVFQISTDSPQTWIVAVHNAKNLEQALRPHSIRIEIIVFGAGLRMLLKHSPVARRLLALHRSGVTIEARRKSLSREGLAPSQILPIVRFIPSAIGEVVRRERQGWAYIRP